MKKETQIKITDKAITGILSAFSNSLKDSKKFSSADCYVSRQFYKGDEKLLKNPSKNGKWRLGYAKSDLTPRDYLKNNYYLGGYMSPDNGFKNLVEEVVDDMCARAIAVCDGSGRGISLFCTVDCIGITNADIRIIRKKFIDKYEKHHKDAKIVSVNVCSTHTHSCVDTEGLWTDFPGKMLRNIRRNRSGHGAAESGTDENYMRFLTETVSNTLVKAAESMTAGEMTLAQKDITSDYFSNRNRPSATALVTDITRLLFTPDDKTQKPTMIINLPAHPDVAGLPTADGSGTGRVLSGDYVHYMDEIISEAGFNFMFFNGAICAIYMSRSASNDGLTFKNRYEQSIRFGKEVGRIALSLTKTAKEIMSDKLLYDEEEISRDSALSEDYTLWCENWEPVSEVKVKPLLNIRLSEVKVPVTNPLLCAVGKLNLANIEVLTEGKRNYSAYTEIGYIEFGKELKVAMVPGEFCCDLLKGGKSLTSEGSASGKAFGYPSVRDIFGNDTIAFGLSNDAIGYIVPDNDYTLGDPENHYHEFVSLGQFVGSSIIKGFCALKESL